MSIGVYIVITRHAGFGRNHGPWLIYVYIYYKMFAQTFKPLLFRRRPITSSFILSIFYMIRLHHGSQIIRDISYCNENKEDNPTMCWHPILLHVNPPNFAELLQWIVLSMKFHLLDVKRYNHCTITTSTGLLTLNGLTW